MFGVSAWISPLLMPLYRSANKRVISLVVGKINVPKFENFPEVDVFCLIHCPESSFPVNPQDYSKPVLTPFELEVRGMRVSTEARAG